MKSLRAVSPASLAAARAAINYLKELIEDDCANAGLVKKVYLPREVFPLASVGSALFNFGVQLVVLLIATVAVLKPPLHLEILYAVPSLAVIVVYGLAFGMFFGAVNVYLRDIQYLVEVATMLLFWASRYP